MIYCVHMTNKQNGVWRHLNELSFFGAKQVLASQVNVNKINKKDLVIFGGGWNKMYNDINLKLKRKGVSTSSLFCSPFGQCDITNENIHLKTVLDLLNIGLIDYIFTGSKHMENVFNQNNIRWLPQFIDCKKFIKKHKVKNIKKKFVGLFCSKEKNKNILNQLASIISSDYTLVTNALDDFNYDFCVKNNIDFINLGWLEEDEYYEKIMECDKILQCSWSESFDYVVAECLLLNKPVIVGPYANWITDKDLIVNNIDDPLSIRIALDKVKNKDYKSIVIKEMKKRKKIIDELFEKWMK